MTGSGRWPETHLAVFQRIEFGPPKAEIQVRFLAARLLRPRARVAPAKSEPLSRLGEQIKALRIAAGKTGGELAARCGVSSSLLSRVERGLVSPSVETLSRIAEGLDVSLSRFFSDQRSRSDLSLVRAGHGIVVDRIGAVENYRYELLGHLLSGNLFVEPSILCGCCLMPSPMSASSTRE